MVWIMRMGGPVVEGPFDRVHVGGGRTADLYLLRYEADGSLISRQAQEGLVQSLGGRTDVFFFSHGWNNTFDAAASSYRRFIDGYASQGTGPGPDDNPVLVGVVWPSTSFTMPWEEGPVIAGGSEDEERRAGLRTVATGSLAPSDASRLSALLGRDGGLTPDEAREAADLMTAFLPDADPEEGAARPTVEEVLEAWAELDGEGQPPPPDPDDFGETPAVTGASTASMSAPDAPADTAPQAAGFLSNLDPRNLARMATVWLMKDRAGKVGARGVAPLVRRILEQPGVRLHLIGHSFGCRLLMSAVSIGPLPRQARSMLLLEPAVNRWCFAANVIGTGRVGGYRPVLESVELPILSTMSSHDLPLRQAFHLAVRGSSLGEPDIAAIGDTERYGALGGYGPAGLAAAAVTQPARPPGTQYDLSGQARVIAVDGSGAIDGRPAIGGHGDINNPNTWWALRCLVDAPVA
jgi:hypothetical protein